MQFQVPQFIEVEDKVIGPLTFKQFIYLLGGAAMVFVFYTFLPLLIALPLILAAAAFSGALAFYKVNNKPFMYIAEAAFKYFFGSKLYIWRKKPKKVIKEGKIGETNSVSQIYVPKLSDSKLQDLSWSLDVHEVGESEGGKISAQTQ